MRIYGREDQNDEGEIMTIGTGIAIAGVFLASGIAIGFGDLHVIGFIAVFLGCFVCMMILKITDGE